MSTRSIDRYIRAGKLRSKKDGKIIYIHETDIDNIASGWKKKQEVIVPHQETVEKKESTKIVSNQNTSSALEKVYIDLREEMKRKDSAIQELSIRLGRAEEIAKNSVSLIEFKKSQFLLEESKGFLNKEVEELREAKTELTKKLKYEKHTNIIIISILFVLLIITATIWFWNI